MRSVPCTVVSVAIISVALGNNVDAQQDVDPQQAAKDATVVETLLRLKGIDVNASPKLQAAVLRHLQTQQGTPRYVELVEKLNVRGVEDELVQLALEQPDSTQGVRAVQLLLKFDQAERLRAVLDAKDDQAAIQAATALGYAGSKQAVEMLEPLVDDRARSRPLRTAAAGGLGRNRLGQRLLLELVKTGGLPADLSFTAANVLFASTDPSIRDEARKHLTLPAAANAQPLPPVAEMVKMRGDAAHGQQLFKTTATCANCHKVRREGKEVGPDLSEIGSKLSREALLISVLDPSAGISHNYENYSAILDSGNIVSGILVNRTDEQLTLRTAEAIDKTFAVDEIEELVKSDVSLMPADLQKTMSAQDLVDVVEYLAMLKKG